MKTKDLFFAAAGLLVGLVVGIVFFTIANNNGLDEAQVRAIVAEENAGLQTSLLTQIAALTAPDTPGFTTRQVDAADSSYFLVTMDQAEAWLSTVAEENEETFALQEQITEAIENARNPQNSFGSMNEIELFFDTQVSSVDGMLAGVYDALMINLSEGVTAEEEDLSVCLGLDNDPYSLDGPTIYLYLQVPEATEEELPKEWELLDGPREESMLWTAECYDPEAEAETETEDPGA
ncbi:MAG: hypothetical protein ACOCYT_02000 [Chloroflexota bacterium]